MKVAFVKPTSNWSCEDKLNHQANKAMPENAVGYGMLHIATILSNFHDVGVYSLPSIRTIGNFKQIIKKIEKSEAVGIELNWLQESEGTINLANYLKTKNANIIIFVGGTHASLFANRLAKEKNIDYVLRGESELSIIDLIGSLEKKKNKKIRGILSKNHDGGMPRVIENLDDVPQYDPSLIKTDKSKLIFAVNRCRGQCPWKCSYCIGGSIGNISGRRKFALHSPEWIVRQVEILKENGIKHFIEFQDQAWCLKDKSYKFLKKLSIELRKNDLCFDFQGFFDVAAPILNKEVLNELSKSNIVRIDYGCESGSQKVLKRVNRKFSIQKMLETIEVTAKSGIIPATWWMVGFPGEDRSDVMKTAEAVKKTVEVGGVPFWLAPLIVFPKTELFENSKKNGIKLRYSSFEDYSKYSNLRKYEIELKRYKHAITHETDKMNADEIINAATFLRKSILNLRDLMVDKSKEYQKYFLEKHPQFSENWYYKQINQWLNNIRSSLF